MRFNTPFIVALVVTAEHGNAQDNPTATNTAKDANTTPQSIPTCVLTCASLVASRNGCDDAASASCLCTAADSKSSVDECITTNCLEEVQAAASGFLAELCSNADQPIKSDGVSASFATTSTTSSARRAITTLNEGPMSL
ncbi:hypothetical protein FS837_004405, partial [Tulasnella sp. UAMH 9824]